MLDSFETKQILEGFRKRAKAIPGFNKQKKQIEQAVDFALQAHKGQRRKYSGRPFIHHPLKVATNTYEQYHDPILFIAAILHDTIEDGPEVVPKQIYDIFGDEIGFIVDAVSDNIMYLEGNKDLIFTDKIEKLLYGGMQDVRVLLLKILDRKHNLLGLTKQANKQIKKGFETQAIYEPLQFITGYTQDIHDRHIHQQIFQTYIKKNKLKSADDLKNNLYDITFANVTPELFEMTKDYSHNIIREINDRDVFKELLNIPDIDKKIKIIQMETAKDEEFSVTFKYLKLELIDTKDKKISLHGFNS